jgi:hypothetical protein
LRATWRPKTGRIRTHPYPPPSRFSAYQSENTEVTSKMVAQRH